MTDRQPCATCAFRPGTDAAERVATQLTVRLCLMSGETFTCHESSAFASRQ